MKKNNSISHLNSLQVAVTQNKSTEAPFSGEYNDFYEDGIYSCVCCNSLLFDSDSKFNSFSGWPSFTKPANESALLLKEDGSLNMKRVEVCCSQCESHLGHVFDDGPPPEYKRYCINSAAIQFKSS